MNIGSPPSQQAESEKFGIIPTKIDDLKKTYKTFKVSLNESLGAFINYGKSLTKASRNPNLAFNHADPSFICKLTLNLLNQQAQTSQALELFMNEALREFSKEMDMYEDKLEQTRSRISDKISENVRLYTLARGSQLKEQANYEKVCREAENAMIEKKKPISDPLFYYNITHHRKLNAKVKEELQNLRASEQHARDALETSSNRQQALNAGLSESMQTFKETLRTVLETVSNNVKKHNQIMQDFLQKELNQHEKSDVLETVGTFSFPSDAQEQEYIQKIAPTVPSDSYYKTSSKFLDTHYKFLEKPQNLSEQEVYDYTELAQKHYEASLFVFEERQKVIKGLKAYMLESAALCSATEKTFQKISKNLLGQVSTTTLSKQLGSNIDALFEGLVGFGSVFQQLSWYLNSKAPALDGLVNDYKEYVKGFQAKYTRALKDSIGMRNVVNTLVSQQDKLSRKIAEVSEKDPDDVKIPGLMEELDNAKKFLREEDSQLRRLTVETAVGINKAFDDYRIQDQMKFMEFQKMIKGHLEHENKLMKKLTEILMGIEAGLEAGRRISVEEKAEKALREDGLNGQLQFYETNMQEVQSTQNVAKQQPEFKKLYVLPEDTSNDEDDIEKADGGDDEDENGGDKETENVDEGGASEKAKRKFGLKGNQKLLKTFTCAVEQTIIRQGRMYVFDSVLCFATGKLLGRIKLVIPLEDIVGVEKKTVSLVFDTAMTVLTKNGNIKFMSFFFRDKAYKLITSLLRGEQPAVNGSFVSPDKERPKSAQARASPNLLDDEGLKQGNKSDVEESKPVGKDQEEDNIYVDSDNNSVNSALERKTDLISLPVVEDMQKDHREDKIEVNQKSESTGSSQDDEKARLLKLIEQRKPQLSAIMVSEDTCPQMMAHETFACSALDLYTAAFSERKVSHNSKNFECFWVLAKAEGGDKDIKYNKWSPETPFEGVSGQKDSLEFLKKLAEGSGKTTRSLIYTHPVKEGGPFVPKTCQVDENHTGYWLSPTEFVMYMQVQTSKVPMSDCFFARNYFKIKEISESKCEFTWKLGLEFVKSTMFKGKISKATQDENLSFANKVFIPLLKEKIAVLMKEKGQGNNRTEVRSEVEKARQNPAVREQRVINEENKEDRKVHARPEIKITNVDEQSIVEKSSVQNVEGAKNVENESTNENLRGELAKVVNEVQMLRKLVFALIVLNSLVLLFVMFRG